MKLTGSCHCRNVTFELDWSPDPGEIPARACGCSFCAKHGGLWTATPTGSLRVAVRSPGRVSAYAFGTGTARFHVCADCGAVPVVTSEISGRLYGVVSVRALDDVDRALVREAPASFDGEPVEARLARRAKGWIPDVRFVAAADDRAGAKPA